MLVWYEVTKNSVVIMHLHDANVLIPGKNDVVCILKMQGCQDMYK